MATIELQSALHPEVMKAIGSCAPSDDDPTVKSCGCHQRGERDGVARWFLCDYHEGFSDGLWVAATLEG